MQDAPGTSSPMDDVLSLLGILWPIFPILTAVAWKGADVKRVAVPLVVALTPIEALLGAVLWHITSVRSTTSPYSHPAVGALRTVIVDVCMIWFSVAGFLVASRLAKSRMALVAAAGVGGIAGAAVGLWFVLFAECRAISCL